MSQYFASLLVRVLVLYHLVEFEKATVSVTNTRRTYSNGHKTQRRTPSRWYCNGLQQLYRVLLSTVASNSANTVNKI
jgi:hypothetical protein